MRNASSHFILAILFRTTTLLLASRLMRYFTLPLRIFFVRLSLALTDINYPFSGNIGWRRSKVITMLNHIFARPLVDLQTLFHLLIGCSCNAGRKSPVKNHKGPGERDSVKACLARFVVILAKLSPRLQTNREAGYSIFISIFFFFPHTFSPPKT